MCRCGAPIRSRNDRDHAEERDAHYDDDLEREDEAYLLRQDEANSSDAEVVDECGDYDDLPPLRDEEQEGIEEERSLRAFEKLCADPRALERMDLAMEEMAADISEHDFLEAAMNIDIFDDEDSQAVPPAPPPVGPSNEHDEHRTGLASWAAGLCVARRSVSFAFAMIDKAPTLKCASLIEYSDPGVGDDDDAHDSEGQRVEFWWVYWAKLDEGLRDKVIFPDKLGRIPFVPITSSRDFKDVKFIVNTDIHMVRAKGEFLTVMPPELNEFRTLLIDLFTDESAALEPCMFCNTDEGSSENALICCALCKQHSHNKCFRASLPIEAGSHVARLISLLQEHDEASLDILNFTYVFEAFSDVWKGLQGATLCFACDALVNDMPF